MTKKKNLTAFMIAIIVMLFSLPANAQEKKGYAKYDENSNTLTFYGGEMPTTGAYALNTDSNKPAWNCDDASDVSSSCTKVVFDESFNDVRPKSCCFWFQGFSNLSTIKDIRYLNTDNVTYMHSMFDGCSGLNTLDVSKFNTAKVTHMTYMFNGCSSLTSLDLSSFNTANVEFMYHMFNGCKSLTSLDLSSFNTAKVGLMYNMFNGCSGLTSLDLSSFNTANVTEMDNMFNGCSGLTSLDLSSFNTAKVTNMKEMFNGCSDLTTIYVSDGFTTGKVSYSNNMFTGCTKLKGAVLYNSNQTDKNMAKFDGYFTESNLTPYVKWDANTKVLTFKVANYIEGTQGEWKLNEGDTFPGWLGDDVPYYCTNVVFTPSFKQAKPTSCSRWFYGFSKLSTIKDIRYLNTDSVTTMHAMFSNCSELTSLDVSKFNTANVTTMRAMFANCSKLTSLGVSNFNTTKVKNMSFMFNGCSGLTSLDLSSFNTDSVTYMECMFYGCSGLTSLDVSNFNTANVTWMYYMFNGCSGLTSLDLSSFNTANVTWMYDMFNGCSGLTTIYASDDFTTDKVNNGTGMFENCTNLKGAVAYDSNKTGHSMAKYKTGYFKTYFTLGEKKVVLCGEPLTESLTTESLDLSGDYDFTPKFEAFTAKSATYTRDLSTSGSKWYTLCLPFAYNTPTNFTAYKLKSATDNSVEIEEMTGEIAAGTPIIFKFKDGANKNIDISVNNADIKNDPGMASTTEDDCRLYGTYQEKTFSLQDGNTFIIYKDRLMNPATMLQNNNSVTKVGVRPFHAYMTMTSQAGAKSFSIGSGDEGTTAIDLLNSVATDDAEYYDINGRRIDAPAKGVNIVRRGNKTMKLIIK